MNHAMVIVAENIPNLPRATASHQSLASAMLSHVFSTMELYPTMASRLEWWITPCFGIDS